MCEGALCKIDNKCQFSIHSIPTVDKFQLFLGLAFNSLSLDYICITCSSALYLSSSFPVVAGEKGVLHVRIVQSELRQHQLAAYEKCRRFGPTRPFGIRIFISTGSLVNSDSQYSLKSTAPVTYLGSPALMRTAVLFMLGIIPGL